MIIKFKHKGDFKKTHLFFNKIKRNINDIDLDRYGRDGVEALRSATPIDTGNTASKWYYEIEKSKQRIKIKFLNSNIQNGVPIAIILQYGHATKNGGWVEGRDYINPSIQPVFNRITDSVWGEVSRL
jgi:hypothetical protein